MRDPSTMKIGEAVRFSDMETSLDRATGWCTECLRRHGRKQWPKDEVMVVRHWRRNSTAGSWIWYCPNHFANAKPWKTDVLAPSELR